MGERAATGDGTSGRRINAAIVGAQRCGTTSLAALLEQHPDICLAAGKEANFFSHPAVQRDGIDARRWSETFGHWRGEAVLLDASPNYLYLPGSLETLHRHNPAARIIAILRDPAERARSGYALQISRGTKLGPYWRALIKEKRRLADDRNALAEGSPTRVASLRDRGRYSRQVATLLEWFPDALVLRFDELVKDHAATLRRITDHLGIEPLPTSAEMPWVNERRSRVSWALLDPLVRRSLRGDMRATEDLLGWPHGSLAAARLGATARQRPRGPL